ncbi:MAG TPA: hypothetical protein VEA17_02480 [Bordetella sp.]|nr:hypothetical protein [Bordetella sp.]
MNPLIQPTPGADMKKRYSITVHARWDVAFDASPQQVARMRADGLVIDEICNTVPEWLPAFLVRGWCRAQDAWQWLRVF